MGVPPPHRWRLRPGVHVVRRDARHLQVGIDPPHRAIVPDTPAVRTLLRDLRAAARPDAVDATAGAVLRTLRHAGLVLREDGAPAGPSAATTVRRAAEAQFGDGAGRRLAARSRARVGVRAATGPRTAVVALLRACGLGVADDADAVPTAWLVVTATEPPRADIDPLVREGVPHLLVACGPVARIGPFVAPGRTACLRCVDAHLAEPDPRRPLVVEQAARAAQDAFGVDAAPVDPALEALALAWAVRDLARHAEGDRPSSWSATVEIGPAGPAVRREWQRHPHCGCAWDVVL